MNQCALSHVRPLDMMPPHERRHTSPAVVPNKKSPAIPAYGVACVERQCLTPFWTRPEFDAFVAEKGRDGRIGNTKAGAKPGK